MNSNEAHWIWSGGRSPKPLHFVWFRKQLVVPDPRRGFTLRCAADSKYRLWINGRYVGTGPARGDPRHPYRDEYAVDAFLSKGRNVVTFLVVHYSAGSIIFSSVQGGLLCQLVDAEDRVHLVSDRTWRARTATAWHGIPCGYLHPSTFDARLEPVSWRDLDGDDSAWPYAVEIKRGKLAPPSALIARPTAGLTNQELQPVRVLAAGPTPPALAARFRNEREIAPALHEVRRLASQMDIVRPRLVSGSAYPRDGLTICSAGRHHGAYLELDFGRETLAAPMFRIRSAGGVTIDIGYGEVLENDRASVYRQNIFLADRVITRRGTTDYQCPQPRGFRFLRLHLSNFAQPVHFETVSAREEIYTARSRATFAASDPVLEQVHTLCVRTMNLCMEDAYTDCPWRERQQWLGDMAVETLTAHYVFNATDLTRKALREFAASVTAKGFIPAVYPGGNNLNLPTFAMRYPVIIREYHSYSGDTKLLRELWPSVRRVMRWLDSQTNRLSFFPAARAKRTTSPQKDFWNFVDWTKLDEFSNDGAVQGFLLEAYQAGAAMAHELGEHAGADWFGRKAKELERNIVRHFWSPSRRAFLKYRRDGSSLPHGVSADLIGQHENFFFPLLGVGTPAMRRLALRAAAGHNGKYLPNLSGIQSAFLENTQTGTVKDQPLVLLGSPYWSFFALKSLFQAGRHREALDYIRIGWGGMLDQGATSCWEMWDRHTSACHGYSTGPAPLLARYVLGVQPLKPGFKVFSVAPAPGDLVWARGTVPSPKGKIHVHWRQSGRAFRIDVGVPAGTTCQVIPPRGRMISAKVVHNGRRIVCGRKIILAAGHHHLCFQ